MISPEQPAFLPGLVCMVLACWLVPQRWLSGFLVLSCGAFLAFYAPWSLLMLTAITALTVWAVLSSHRHAWSTSIVISSFFISFIVYRLTTTYQDVDQSPYMLGMAFYILRASHLVIENYAGRLNSPTSSQILAWLWFLPTLQVGPINRFAPFQQDLMRRRWDSINFANGLQRILFGYVKIIVLGNYLINNKFDSWLERLPHDSWWYHYLDSVQYGLHLYIKFAGYSDIAIGFALLLGFRVAENFNFPFLAKNINDFWKRWHISLSSWCRDYIYLPVIAYTRIPALAAIGSMLVLGAWHELSWRYLLWGVWHGTGIAACQLWQRTQFSQSLNHGWKSTIWTPLARFITINFVILSFTLTGTDSIQACLGRWQILLGILP